MQKRCACVFRWVYLDMCAPNMMYPSTSFTNFWIVNFCIFYHVKREKTWSHLAPVSRTGPAESEKPETPITHCVIIHNNTDTTQSVQVNFFSWLLLFLVCVCQCTPVAVCNTISVEHDRTSLKTYISIIIFICCFHLSPTPSASYLFSTTIIRWAALIVPNSKAAASELYPPRTTEECSLLARQQHKEPVRTSQQAGSQLAEYCVSNRIGLKASIMSTIQLP